MRIKIETLKNIFKQVNLKKAFIYLKAKEDFAYVRIYNDVLEYQLGLDNIELRDNEEIEFLTELKLLSDLVSKFNAEEEVSLNVENNSLILQTTKSLYSLSLCDLKTLKSEESNFKKTISVDLEKFKYAIRKVLFAINTNSSKATLQGLHLYTKTNDKTKVLVFETTNSYILAKYELNNSFTYIQKDIDVIIPFETLQNVLLLQGSKTLEIDLNDNKTIISFGCENVKINSVLISGDFPSLNNVYKMSCDIKTSFKKEELVNALNRLSLFTDITTLDLISETLTSYKDNCTEKLNMSTNTTKSFYINIRINDLLDAIKQVESDYIDISFLDNKKPFKIIDSDLLIVLTPTITY